MIKAYGFALAKTNDSSATEKWFDLVDAKIFYLDKDGDAITISSNEELTDLIKASPRANK
jgi:ABC-type amino acid transport substrate-binding protein